MTTAEKRRAVSDSFRRRHEMEQVRFILSDRLEELRGEIENGCMTGISTDSDKVQSSGISCTFAGTVDSLDALERQLKRIDSELTMQDRILEALTDMERDIFTDTIINHRSEISVSMERLIGERTVRRVKSRALEKASDMAFGDVPTYITF